MALSDCAKCWDTPCTCGHDGYYLIYKSEVPDGYTRDNILQAIKNNLQDGTECCVDCGSTNLDMDDPRYYICNDCELCTDVCNYK